MLDMKQMLPRVIAGSLIMFFTIALVAMFAYRVLESSPDLNGSSKNVAQKPEGLPLIQSSPGRAKALHRISHHKRGRIHSKHGQSASAHQRRLLESFPIPEHR